jgi:hypothetical protein
MQIDIVSPGGSNMGTPPRDLTTTSPNDDALDRFHPGLSILLEAYDYALQLQCSIWDFAVEISALRRTGLTNSDLRWLAYQGIVEHAAEGAMASSLSGRTFHRTGTLTFTKRTCFVLTKAGAALARTRCESPAPAPLDKPETPPSAVAGPPVPKWDMERQELRVGALVVKQFKVPAPNQEIILAAFQEEGWPPRIDDPLPPHAEQDSKRRLHDTITTLNRHQKHRLIRFSGDGSGEGVRWEFVSPEPGSE